MNQHWLDDEVDQQNLLSGNAAFPPDVQWIGRSKWLWPLQQMVAWGMGPALGITAWLGVLFAIGLRVPQAPGRLARAARLGARLLRLHGRAVLALHALLPAALPDAHRASPRCSSGASGSGRSRATRSPRSAASARASRRCGRRCRTPPAPASASSSLLSAVHGARLLPHLPPAGDARRRIALDLPERPRRQRHRPRVMG